MKKILVLSVTFLILVAITGFFIFGFTYKAKELTKIDIKQGESTTQIGQDLKNKKLITSAKLFSLFTYAKHFLLQNGYYEIPAGSKMTDIITLLKDGKITEYSVTIPEGWRVTQIDELMVEKKIIKKGELLAIASADEGYLFPNTYHFPLDVKIDDIKKAMLSSFDSQTADLKPTKEQLIIASIVEREAKFDEDRPKIASIYLNRLKQGMKLEADPTVQYAKGSWAPITLADYKNVQSPYNTYLHDGLPPGPICNPGLKSILAAVNPAQTDYLYFFNTSDGHAVYSKTFAEHQANLKKYQ